MENYVSISSKSSKILNLKFQRSRNPIPNLILQPNNHLKIRKQQCQIVPLENKLHNIPMPYFFIIRKCVLGKKKLPPQIKATLRLLSAGGIQLEIMAIEAGISGP